MSCKIPMAILTMYARLDQLQKLDDLIGHISTPIHKLMWQKNIWLSCPLPEWRITGWDVSQADWFESARMKGTKYILKQPQGCKPAFKMFIWNARSVKIDVWYRTFNAWCPKMKTKVRTADIFLTSTTQSSEPRFWSNRVIKGGSNFLLYPFFGGRFSLDLTGPYRC